MRHYFYRFVENWINFISIVKWMLSVMIAIELGNCTFIRLKTFLFRKWFVIKFAIHFLSLITKTMFILILFRDIYTLTTYLSFLCSQMDSHLSFLFLSHNHHILRKWDGLIFSCALRFSVAKHIIHLPMELLLCLRTMKTQIGQRI